MRRKAHKIGKKKKVIHFICLCVATVLVLVTSMNPTVLYAASVDNNAKCLTEEYFEAYAKSDVERNVDALGNVVVQIKNEDYGIDDKLVLEKATHNIILNGQCVGYFSEEFDINQSSTKNAAASSTWKYLGTNSYYPSNKMVLLSSDYFTALLRIPKLSVTVREAVPSRYHEL